MNDGTGGQNGAALCGSRCVGCAERATWIVLFINLGMFLLKAVFAVNSHSRSLMADAIESLGDVAITGLVMLTLTIVAKDKDEKHPYGYGKVEFLIATVINFLLLLASLAFMGIGLWEMFTIGPERPPSMMAAVVAGVSVVGNYIAYKYCKCAGEKFQSQALLANGMVNWADSVTSIAVVFAVITSNLAFPRMDDIISIMIGFVIARLAIRGLETSVKELLDFSPGMQSSTIAEATRGVAGVAAVREVKTRLVGRNLWVDLEVLIAAECTMGEGLLIIQRIKSRLLRDRRDIAEISVRLAIAK